jgi:hypothetical protein
VWLLNYPFETVLDGRNTYLCDGVQRALGREPTDFAEYAARVAALGVWDCYSTPIGLQGTSNSRFEGNVITEANGQESPSQSY